jgi:hypothetical protein
MFADTVNIRLSPSGGKSAQNGFASEITAWLRLSTTGATIGGTIPDGSDPPPPQPPPSPVSIPTLAVAPVSNDDMWAMYNDWGPNFNQQGIAIVMGAVP